MATFVSFLDLKTGATIDVNANDDRISSLKAVPSSVLTPIGQPNGTYIVFDTGAEIAVRGTLAATAAALTSAGYVTPAQLAAAIAAFALTLADAFTVFAAFTVSSNAAIITAQHAGGLSATATGVADWKWKLQTAHRAKSLDVEAFINTIADGAGIDLFVTKNGVNTGLTVHFAPLETGVKSVTTNIDFAAGDKVGLRSTAGQSTVNGQLFDSTAIVRWSPVIP